MVKGRNFVRFETFTPLGTTAALYVSNQTGPALLIPSQKMIFTAQHPETLIREFLGVSLPVGMFRYALTASIPPERLNHIESRSEDGMLRLISKSEGSYFEWQIAAGALDRVFVGSSQFEGKVSYDPPAGLAKEAVPAGIRISSKGWDMEILIQELRPGSKFQPGTFHIPNLPDVKRIDLDKAK